MRPRAVALAVALLASASPSAAAVPSHRLRLEPVVTIAGDISPKSVVASQHGLVFAQNMMYRHSITVYDRRHRLVRTISDRVDLARLGIGRRRRIVRGAPVEAAFSADGRYAYVSNYSMYGPGFGPEGTDTCSPASGFDASVIYRIDTRRLAIDHAYRVGAVPKFLATTPDGRFLLVANWCDYDLTVIDLRRDRVVRRIPIGPYPRGIAISADSRRAYVAVMGSDAVRVVDLRRHAVVRTLTVGSGPRHLVLSPDGLFLYATLNAVGRVVKVDTRSGRVRASIASGRAPRSMTIAPDGRSLYVVNYDSDTVTKIATGRMSLVQTVRTNGQPIGVTYDAATSELWIACYSGTIQVLRDGS